MKLTIVRAALRLTLAALVVAQATPPAHAWGGRAHLIASQITMQRLTPTARRAIDDLLLNGDTLADIATWADHEALELPEFRDSRPWHYVNVPIDEDRYADRYCRRGDCVVAKIHEYRNQLADPRTPLRERRRALLFFVHFVQDVHQPLHVGDNRDRGGNNTQVQFFNEATNLHRLWDSGLIDRERRTIREWVDRINRRITPEAERKWVEATVEDWATESLRLARRAYAFPRADGRPMASGASLRSDYYEFALPIVEERLAQAGVRLAHELNRIFR